MSPQLQHKLDQAFRLLGIWISPEGYKVFLDYLSSQGIKIEESV